MYKITDDPEIQCLECGGPIYGRPDKKFCSPCCKNKYHGHLRHAREKVRSKEMDILVQNYSILETALCLNGGHGSIAAMERMGFRPEYVTQVIKKGKHLEYRCFDFAYSICGDKISGLRKLG